jgi:hypothetical protein
MDEKELIDLKEQVNDTHRLVVKLYKYQKRESFFRVLKMVVILVIIVGAYYALSPVFTKLANTYNNVSNGVLNFSSNANSFFGNNSSE